jgi:hypothetical protein
LAVNLLGSRLHLWYPRVLRSTSGALIGWNLGPHHGFDQTLELAVEELGHSLLLTPDVSGQLGRLTVADRPGRRLHARVQDISTAPGAALAIRTPSAMSGQPNLLVPIQLASR